MLKRIALVALLITLFLSHTCIASSPWSRVAESTRRSIARMSMHVESEAGEGTGYCTAFSINERKNLYLTAAHCQGDHMAVDGERAVSLFSDDVTDLQVLQVVGLDRPALTMADAAPSIGEPVAAMGFGYGLDHPMFRTGPVSIVDLLIPELHDSHFLMVGVEYIGGMSGGPVVDVAGRVVSIVQNGRPGVGIGRTLDVIRATTARYWSQ